MDAAAAEEAEEVEVEEAAAPEVAVLEAGEEGHADIPSQVSSVLPLLLLLLSSCSPPPPHTSSSLLRSLTFSR